MARKKIKFGNAEVMADEIEFEPEKEGWNSYILHDGTTLKVRTVVSDILRVEGHFAPNGDPLYIVNASMVVNSSSPEQLRKKD